MKKFIYYPYLRGRQFELIALRELSEKHLIGNYVIPIIEPLKLSRTLMRTLQVFQKEKMTYAWVRNPQYGTFLNQIQENMQQGEELQVFLQNKNVILAYWMNNQDTDLINQDEDKLHLMIINNDHDDLEAFNKIYNTDEEPDYTLIPDDRSFNRRIRKNNKILFKDNFKMAARNVDYKEHEDEFFSENYLYVKDDGYNGISDYSIIGSKYSETGFAPVAVAIHIVYVDKDNNLRVHHFVSDSNEGIEDPARKFGEAIYHLSDWCQKNPQLVMKTDGLKNLLNYQKTGVYPGLGTVKKYSIMHHLELMENFLRQMNES